MIITKEVEVGVVYSTLEYYKNKGYDAHTNKKITVKVEDLTEHSHIYILVKCDSCGKIKKMKYLNYNVYVKNGIYNCNKCNGEKRKKTCLKKYGVEYISQVEEVKDRIKETCIEKYGVDNPSKSKDIIEKMKQIFIEKYGVENPMFVQSIKDKMKNIFIEKYGVENPYQSEKIKEKIKETLFNKYGVYHPMESDEFKKKLKETFVEKYGVENPNKNKDILEKSKLTRIKKGMQTPDSQLTEWQKYRKIVKNITNNNKKELYEKWNGHDYYDNEYIKDNRCYKHKDYPTIDHKISIFFGFNNNILPEIIGDLDNLCITKKWINSSKNRYIKNIL